MCVCLKISNRTAGPFPHLTHAPRYVSLALPIHPVMGPSCPYILLCLPHFPHTPCCVKLGPHNGLPQLGVHSLCFAATTKSETNTLCISLYAFWCTCEFGWSHAPPTHSAAPMKHGAVMRPLIREDKGLFREDRGLFRSKTHSCKGFRLLFSRSGGLHSMGFVEMLQGLPLPLTLQPTLCILAGSIGGYTHHHPLLAFSAVGPGVS